MKIQKLHDLFLDELREIYDAEKQLLKALPKLAGAASAPQLKAVFEQDQTATADQILRLEQIFDQMDEKPVARPCEAMKGLIKETEKFGPDMEESPLRDAGLIGAAARMKRYEMNAYTSVRTVADMLGYTPAAKLIEATLHDERVLDRKLTELEYTELAEQLICETPLRRRPPMAHITATIIASAPAA